MTPFFQALALAADAIVTSMPRLCKIALHWSDDLQQMGINRMSGNALHHCPNCRAALIAARLSRYVNERCVSNLWSCVACGHEHETSAIFWHGGRRSVAIERAENHADFYNG